MMGLPDCSSCERQPEIHVALQIERRHVRIGGIVEPGARAQARGARAKSSNQSWLGRDRKARRPSCSRTPVRDRAAPTESPGGSARPERPAAPGTARRPGDRCGPPCRCSCHRENCPSRTATPGAAREQLHDATGVRILEARRRPQRPRATVQHEIVIVAATETQLLVTPVVNALADRMRACRKSNARARDCAALAGRNQRRIDRRVRVGEHRQPMAREYRCGRSHRRD